MDILSVFFFILTVLYIYSLFRFKDLSKLNSSRQIFYFVFSFSVLLFFFTFTDFFSAQSFNAVLCFIGISCGIPPEGTNTVTVPQDNLLFEQMYNYSCLTGYETSDSLTTQCLSEGSWSLPSPPSCNSEFLLTYLTNNSIQIVIVHVVEVHALFLR